MKFILFMFVALVTAASIRSPANLLGNTHLDSNKDTAVLISSRLVRPHTPAPKREKLHSPFKILDSHLRSIVHSSSPRISSLMSPVKFNDETDKGFISESPEYQSLPRNITIEGHNVELRDVFQDFAHSIVYKLKLKGKIWFVKIYKQLTRSMIQNEPESKIVKYFYSESSILNRLGYLVFKTFFVKNVPFLISSRLSGITLNEFLLKENVSAFATLRNVRNSIEKEMKRVHALNISGFDMSRHTILISDNAENLNEDAWTFVAQFLDFSLAIDMNDPEWRAQSSADSISVYCASDEQKFAKYVQKPLGMKWQKLDSPTGIEPLVEW